MLVFCENVYGWLVEFAGDLSRFTHSTDIVNCISIPQGSTSI